MATETNMQESVCLEKGERVENALKNEIFEEKVTALPGNKAKQLETSNQVGKTVNKPLETGEPTDESGTFFQTLSVPMVIADEHSKTLESCKAATQTEPEEETIETEEKAIESEEGLKFFDSVALSKKDALNMLEKNQGDSDGVTSSQDADIKETSEQYATTVEESTEDQSVDAQKATDQCEDGLDTEKQKSEEIVKKIEQHDEIEEIRPDVEMKEKKEQNGITSDACISAQTKSQIETRQHEEKDKDEEKEQGANVLDKCQDKDDTTSAQEVTFEGGLQEKTHQSEDNEHEVVEAKEIIEEDADVCFSTQTTIIKESVKNEETSNKKAIGNEVCKENGLEKGELGGLEISDSKVPSPKETPNLLEKNQGESVGVTSSQEEPCVDVKETTTVQHVTTVIDFKEQDQNEKPREFIKEETDDKSLDAQEASEKHEKGAKEEIEQNPEGGVKKIEKEEQTKEIKQDVEIEEKNELLSAITTDVCFSMPTKSQVEKTEQEKGNTQNDDGQKEKSDSSSIKEVCEKTGLEKDEHEKEVKHSAIETVNKDKNEDKKMEQEDNVLEKDACEDDVTSAQDMTCGKNLQEKNHHDEDDESEAVTAEESIEKDTEVIRSSEKTDQHMLMKAIPSDVCIATLTEQEETTEKNEVSVEKDDGQTNKSGIPMENEIHEAKEKEIYASGKGQSDRDDVPSSENASNKDIKEKAIGQHDTTVAYFETGQGLSATHGEILKEEAKDTSVDAEEETEHHDNEAHDEREQKLEECVNETVQSFSKNEQEEYTEKIKPSVETIEEKDVCISTQISSQEEAKKNENAIESEDDQKEKLDNPFVNEVCEENDLKKTEPDEERQLSDSSNVKTRESVDEDTEENKSIDETKENMEQQGLLHVITADVCRSLQTEHKEKATESNENNDEEIRENDDDQTKKLESHMVEVVCEATRPEMAESEGVKHSDSHSTTLNEKETLNKEEKLEKKHENEMSEVQSGVDDATSSQNPSNDDIEETTLGQQATTVAYVEGGQGVSAMPKEILIEEAEDKSVDAEEVAEQFEDGEKEKREQKPEEIVNKAVNSCSGIIEGYFNEAEVDATNNKEIEAKLDAENQADRTIDRTEMKEGSVLTKKMSLELGQPNEQNVEEVDSLSKTISENPQDEIKKEDKDLSHESVDDTNNNTTKEEKCTLEHELAEEHYGQDEASIEKITELDETELEPQEDITHSSSLQSLTKDTSNSGKEKQENENLPIDLKTVSEVQILELVPKSEDSTLKEEYFISETKTHLDEEKRTIMKEISSDEKTEQTAEIKPETNKEVCEETSTEKAELEEGSKLYDSSNTKINEKEMTTFKDDDQENDHKVNMSAESQGKDNITSSQNDVSEQKEDLKENNYHNEGDECDFTKSGEGVGEDTDENKSSVETKENTEHVVTTDVYSSTQTQPDEKTRENGGKNGEKAMEYNENETMSREENLKKKQEDVEETKMGEHATTVVYFEEEQSLGIATKEVLDKEGENKSDVTQEETEYGENREREQKLNEHTYEITPSVETNEEKVVCISTQVDSQEEATENEENAIKSDGDRKEMSDNPFVKEVCEENDLKNTESEEERQLSDNSNVKSVVSVDEDTRETQSCNETKENMEQEGLLPVTTTDVYSSTQAEYVEETTGSEEKNDEETTENDESSEMAESKEVKLSDSLSTTLNENETLRKEAKLEKEYEIKTSEVQGGRDDVTSSRNACNEDRKETTIGQYESSVACVKEGQGVSAMPKEILIEEAHGKSIEVEEMSLKLGQPNEQNVEETHPCPSKTINEDLEDEIKKKEIDLSHESVKDTNGNTTKEEKCKLEQESVEENSGQDEVSQEKITTINETTKVEPQEDITPSISLETSSEDASNSKKEKAESEKKLPIEDLETISDVQILELVPKSEESVLKEECFISETETHLDEGKKTIRKEISSDEASELGENGAKDKIEQQSEESVNKTVNSCSETIERSIKEEEANAGNKEVESEPETKDQADRIEDRSEMEDEAVLMEKVSNELGQTKEQNLEEIQTCLIKIISEKTEDKITNKDEDLSHDSIEHINENITKEEKCFPDGIIKETEISALEHEHFEERNDSQDEVMKEKTTDSAVEPQEDITPSSSLRTSTIDSSNSDKKKAESENLPMEDLQSVPEVHIPDIIPRTEESKMKEEGLVSATATYVDEENRTVTREISNVENLETHGSTQQPHDSYSTTEENVTQLEQNGEINSYYENRDMKGDVAQESQLNSTEDCSEMEKGVISTEEIEQVPLEMEKEKGIDGIKEQIVEEDGYSPELKDKSAQNQKEMVHEISYSDSIPVDNPEVTEVNAYAHIGQEDLQAKEDIGCGSKVSNDRVDQALKEERIPSLEDAATVESQVDLSNIESTAYPSESEKLAKQALESECDVQIPEVVADSEDSKVKEECIVLATAEYSNKNNVEEQDTKTNKISTTAYKDHEDVMNAPAKSDEAKSCDLIIEEKALTNEVIEEDQVSTETKPQPEQSDVTSENITNNHTLKSKLEHTSGKDLDDGKEDIEEDFTLAPENEIKSTENQIETTKTIILTDEVAVETEKEKKINETRQALKEDNCPIKLDNTSTRNQKELTNEIEYSKPTPADHEATVKTVDVVNNIEHSETESPYLNTKEATSEFINQENQSEQKKEADESIEAVIPVEDVKTSIREPEIRSVNLEVPSAMDATADKANNKTVEVHEAEKGLLNDDKHIMSTFDQIKPVEEGSGMKQEPLECDELGTLGTAATEDFKISQKHATDELLKISQTQPEIKKYEIPACTVDKQTPNEPHPKENAESKILTEKIDSAQEQGEPIAKSFIPEAANLKAIKASSTEPQCINPVFIDQKDKSESIEPAKIYLADALHEPAKGNSEEAENLSEERDSALTKDQQVKKEEIGERGVKTDEEDEEEDDNEDDEKVDSCSDAPVMVEASKDMDPKVHKKSQNILSGVGSKVKHSIAKVKKAITGKSSQPKPPSPKAKN